MPKIVTVPRVYALLVGALLRYFDSEDTDGRLSHHKIGDLRKYGYNPGLARPGLDWLVVNGILQEWIDEDDQGNTWKVWEFTSDGAQYADLHFELDGALRQEKPPTIIEWQPLELEQSDLDDAVSDVEALYERVRGDNEFAEKQPKIQSSIAESLKAGLVLLKSKIITRTQLQYLIINPATWLSVSFARAALGELAKQVITAFHWLI